MKQPENALRVVTFNIQNRPGETDALRRLRLEHIASLLTDLRADVICLQEILMDDYQFLSECLSPATSTYKPRDDGERLGEGNPVFVRGEDFRISRDCHFWLSETPELPSRSWRARHNRIATVIKLARKDASPLWIGLGLSLLVLLCSCSAGYFLGSVFWGRLKHFPLFQGRIFGAIRKALEIEGAYIIGLLRMTPFVHFMAGNFVGGQTARVDMGTDFSLSAVSLFYNMANPTDIRKGRVLDYQGAPHLVLEMLHRTQGRQAGFVQVTLRNLNTGSSTTTKFRSTDNVDFMHTSTAKLEFSYIDDEGYHFMDPETFEDTVLPTEICNDYKNYLVETNSYDIMLVDDKPVDINLPSAVEMKVIDAPEGIKGDTASNVQKPVTMETGLSVMVPLFIKADEIIRVSTADGTYLGRA